MASEAWAITTARKGSPGLLALLREDALALVVIFGPGYAGWGGLTALMVLGVISGAAGGFLMLAWAVVSFLLYLWGYHWLDERKRQERLAALVTVELPRLAERVMALYSRPVSSPEEEPVAAEVFALYWQAQQSLELEKNPRRAGEMIERGVLLADEILTGNLEEARNSV